MKSIRVKIEAEGNILSLFNVEVLFLCISFFCFAVRSLNYTIQLIDKLFLKRAICQSIDFT